MMFRQGIGGDRAARVGCAGLSLAVALLGAGQAARAQTEPSAAAANAGADGKALAEIVVVARKRAENLQKTPVAVTAISGADLVNRSVQSLHDIQQQTPSLLITPSTASVSSNFLSIRGQAYTDLRLNSDPTIGIYVDGVYIPQAVGTDAGSLFDVAQVEVLKGPQGTLFGRNTTGGTINIRTNLPVDRFAGTLRAHLATYGDRSVEGMINIPVAPDIAFRLVGETHGRDGYGRNLALHTRLGDRHGESVRGVLLLTATPALTITLRGDYLKNHGRASAYKPGTVVPGGVLNRIVAAESGLSLTDARNLLLSYAGGDPQNATLDQDPIDRVKVWGTSGTVDLRLGDHASLKSITAYRGYTRTGASDIDATPFPIVELINARIQPKQFSQELQLGGDMVENRLKYILGGYFSNERGIEQSTQGATITDGTLRSRSIAAFAQGTYAITEQLSVTGGLRYTRDNRFLDARNRNATTCLALGRLLSAGPCTASFRTDAGALSYVASAEFKPTQDILLYAKTSRGYRSGGLPGSGGSAISPVAAALSFAPFRPEHVTDYELGIKSEWFDRRFRLNIAGYHSNYSDIQRTIAASGGGTAIISLISNVASAKVDGVEIEATALPIARLELRSSAAYTDARYTNYVVNGVDLSKTPFLLTPKWTYSFSGAYTVPVSVGSVRAQLDYSWQDRYVTSGFLGIRPPVGLLNGRVSFTLDPARFDLAIFGRNLINKQYPVYVIDLITPGLGATTTIAGEPRVIGLEFTKHF